MASSSSSSKPQPSPALRTLLLSPSHQYKPLTYSFVSIHSSCILTDHTLATFLPPLDPSKMMDFWLDKFDRAGTANPDVFLVACLIAKPGSSSSTTTTTTASSEDDLDLDNHELAGYAYLQSNATETGPFRGEVLKLLVDPKFRRRGVASAVMAKVEEVAAEQGLTQLVLDTEEGSGAEFLYPKLGYTRVGVVPQEGISPEDGRLVNEIFFYKHLEGHGRTAQVERLRRGLASGR